LSVWGTTLPRYFFTSSGCSRTASENEQKMIPSSASFVLNVVATETLSNTASTATLERRCCSCSGMPSFSKVLRTSGSTSSRLASCFFGFGAE
jgi:hypothetical protein